MSTFDISQETIDASTHLIHLVGEVDIYTAPQLKDRLRTVIDDGAERVIIDLSDATFIDSTTLGILVGGAKKLHPQGGTLAIICKDDDIYRLFQMTHLDQLFLIRPSREEVLQSLQEGK